MFDQSIHNVINFIIGAIILILLLTSAFALSSWLIPDKVVTNKKIEPIVRVVTENGVSDTTYIYKK